jgi:hypothetical protein
MDKRMVSILGELRHSLRGFVKNIYLSGASIEDGKRTINEPAIDGL